MRRLADVLRAKFASDSRRIASQRRRRRRLLDHRRRVRRALRAAGATAFPTASTIKLAILYELFKQAEEGRVDLDAVTPLDRTHAVPGGLLYELTDAVAVAARPGGRDDPAKRQHRDQRADRSASAWPR